MGLNANNIREDFPILSKGMIYFDNSCVTLRPKQVVDKITEYYNEFPACAGRSMHSWGEKITSEVHSARKSVAKFINAKEVVFTRNTTEAINLVSKSFEFKQGDRVLITDKEHNSNLLPWQINEKINLEIINSKPDNTFDMEDYEKKIEGAKFVSVVHTSNLDGVTNPVKEIIKIAHKHGALVMLDAAQSAPHKELNVKDLDVDFLAFSGHKMLGPSGIGALYGKKELLQDLKPFIVGGETVKDTTYNSHVWEDVPEKFEAGLQNYAGILGFAEACKYLDKIGKKNIEKHEIKLNQQITNGLEDANILGPSADQRGGITSFNLGTADPHQIALLLSSSENIMVRSGAHCVHSWFNKHKLSGTVRSSVYIYNTEQEVEKFLNAIKAVKQLVL